MLPMYWKPSIKCTETSISVLRLKYRAVFIKEQKRGQVLYLVF